MIIHLTNMTQILDSVFSKSKKCTENLPTWFKENHMKLNDDKCHLLVTTGKSVSINTDENNVKIKRNKNYSV